MSNSNPDEIVPFLGALRVQYGPREALGHYFLRAAMALRSLGIEVYVSRDVDRVNKLGREYDEARPPAFPAMDAGLAGFGADSWLTLEGRDAQMRTAFFAAARLLRLKGSLKDELESFRLFYWDPAVQKREDDSVEVTAPSAARISGFISLQGSYWVAPRMRGMGLARIFPTLCRLYCLTVWDIDFAVGFLRAANAERGLSLAYGELEPERWVRFRGRWQDDSYFGCNPRSTIEANIQRDTEAVALRETRIAETLETNVSPAEFRHGSNKRL